MKRWIKFTVCILIIGVIFPLGISCGNTQITPPSKVSSDPPPSVPSPPAKSDPGVQTPAPKSDPVPVLPPVTAFPIDQLAQSGRTVFAASCIRCHGDKGQGVTGPPIIGANAKLDKYATAKGLSTFISTKMPPSSPGSLTSQSYQQLLAYLLVENKIALPGPNLDPAQLDTIKLAK